MPTNKLWLEHTERAAWDSVEALRERLLRAEGRLQALASGVDRVPELLDRLDEAKQKHAPSAQSHDEVVAQLAARIEALETELEAAKAQPRIVSFAAPSPVPAGRARLDSEELEPPTRSHDDDDDDDLDLTSFTQAMKRHSESALVEPARDINRLLSLAENKLDDLNELEGAALREAALELAILAGQIYAVSSARRRDR